MKKYISKIKICMLSIIFATFLCFGSAIFWFNDLKTDESKKQNSQLQNTMPESYTGNYIVVNGQVYAETQENEDDSTKLVNIKAKQNDSNATLANNTLQSGLNTFGFSTNGTLNITFIKDEASSSAFADSVLSVATYAYSARNNGDNIASTLSATYNNGTVEMTVFDQNGEVYIETSSDASYTLGELVTGTSQSLNVDNCVFSIDSAVTADDANSNGKTNMLASATLGSSHGRVNLTAAGEPAEKNGQVLKMNNGKITLGSKTTKKIYQPKLDGEAYRKGSAILQAGGTLNLTNLEFSNFSTTTNGGTICTNAGNLTVTGCEFINCQSLSEAEDTGGGAIYANGVGALNIDSCQFTDNNSKVRGGAIYTYKPTTITNSSFVASEDLTTSAVHQENQTLIIENTDISKYGCAIYAVNTTANIEEGCRISNIKVTQGGAIYAYKSTININGGVIGDETLTSINSSNASIVGRAITLNADSVSKINMTGGTISGVYNAQNGGIGGAVVISSGEEVTSSLSGGIIKNCYAAYGAAVYIAGGSKIDISGSVKMQNNYATVAGGAIFADNATVNMTGGEIGDASQTILATSTDFSNKSNGHGGAIYCKDGAIVNLHGGAIAYNVSMQAGGAVFSESATDKISISDSFVAKYNKSAASGGAIYAFGVVTMSGGTLDHNSANGWGGGIIVKTAGNVFSGGTISYNSANSGAGGVCIDGDTTFDGVTIKNNQTAEHGGGIQYNSGTSVIFKSGIIENNSATKLGGGVYVGTGSFSMSGGEIKNNSSGCGGGIYAQSAVNISDGQIYNNKAQYGSGFGLEYTNMGGGLFIKGATLTITGGTIGSTTASSVASQSSKSNWCSNAGGGIGCGGGATLNLNGGSISYNLAPGGGGIYSNDSTDKLNIKGITINYNTTTEWSGGGVYSYGVINMTSGEISYNSSATVGGGLMIKTSGSNQISGGKINNNTGTSAGGGIRVDGTVTISGTTEIKNNRASEGAGISVATGVTISGGTISGNIATRGGAIHNTSSLTITGGTISGNNAETGGAIYNAGTTRISGGNITANGDTTKCIIGGIYSNRTLDVSGGSITNNQSCWGTQNIRIVDGTFTISGNATISTNRANVTNIYIEKGTFNLNSNFTSNNGSISGAIGLNENIYINVNTTLTKTYTVQKSTLTSFDDGDKASSYIAYSTNSTYLSSAKTYLSVLFLPAGRTTSITRKTNYLVMEHTRHAVDLNPILNGEIKGDGVSGVKFGIKINGVDKGYVNDFYDAQILYGSTWEIYGAQYDKTKYVISSGVPSRGTITGYISIEPKVVSLYTITFKVNNSNYGTIGGAYLGGYNLSTATYRVRHDDYDSIIIRDNIIDLHYMELVTATPKTGYRFTSWSGNTSGVIAEDRTITANFSPIFYDLWFEVNHADHGYLNWATNGQTGSSLEYNGAHGDVFQISGSQLRTGDDEFFYAVAKTGYKFSHWNINGTNYTTGQFTLTRETTITAVFVKDSITVTFRVDKYIANYYKIYYSIGGVKYYLYELVNSSGVYSVELPKSFKIGAESLYYDDGSSGETYDTLKAGVNSGGSSLGSVHPSESTNGYFEASMNIAVNSNVTIYISVSRTNA